VQSIRTRDPGWKKIQIRDKHSGSYFREHSNKFVGKKIFYKIVTDPDPGSDPFLPWIRIGTLKPMRIMLGASLPRPERVRQDLAPSSRLPDSVTV
jgi:hypothetical protein